MESELSDSMKREINVLPAVYKASLSLAFIEDWPVYWSMIIQLCLQQQKHFISIIVVSINVFIYLFYFSYISDNVYTYETINI